MQKNMLSTRVLSLVLLQAMVFTFLPAGAQAAQTQPPEPNRSVDTDFFSRAYFLDFGYQNSQWIDSIQTVSVNGDIYQRTSGTFSLTSGTYVLRSSDGRLILPPDLSGTVRCVIQATGYEDLTLDLDTQGRTVYVRSTGETSHGKQDDDGLSFSMEEVVPGYLRLTILGQEALVDGITGIQRIRAERPTELSEIRYKPTLNDTTYYLDTSASAIYFNATPPAIYPGDILSITAADGKTLRLKVTRPEGAYRVEAVSPDTPAGDGMTLHVRLVGAFEPALEAQKGYDAVTGATSSLTVNKNSNVEVQCALMSGDAVPEDHDWVPLHESGLTVSHKGTSVEISPEGSGMDGVYSAVNSTLTLSGTPAKRGTYQISVTVEDSLGRKAVSNALPFLVYGPDEALADRLTLGNSKQAQDGKYLYDMEPWSISKFGGADETVTVPAEIKAWFGSHTSGTYGKLGYAMPDGGEPVQTLLIPTGCDLTLVNMDLLSSVRLVVQSGGRLVLQDSVVQGIVEVEDGGTFSMNYDGHHKRFGSGASINGQLRLKNGSILENAAIYSNTNFIADGNRARKNTEPVVAVLGDVRLKGMVFIRGDEAPTGTDPKTGKSYAGQTGLSVTNGILTLSEDAVLAVYAGGMYATTSVGGTAILLDNGEITGSGTLLAVGGDGMFGSGGSAAAGTGRISAANSFLQGGAAGFPKDAECAGGKAAEDTVSAPSAVRSEGVLYRENAENPHIPRWSGASTVPDRELVEKSIAYISAHGHSPQSGGDSHTAPSDPPAPSGSAAGGSISTVSSSGGGGGSASPKTPAAKSEDKGELSLTDVSQTAYYSSAARWAVEKNIMPAASDGAFSPDADCTRAEAITFLWRAAGSPDPEAKLARFWDTPSESAYYNALCWAEEQGIILGTGTGRFDPDLTLSRAQMVAFLYRAAGMPAAKADIPFSDVEEDSYYADAVRWGYGLGIVQGTGGNRFSPNEPCTRAQTASLLFRGVQQSAFPW